MSAATARLLVGAVVLATLALEAASLMLAAGTDDLGLAAAYAANNVVQACAGAVIVWTYPRHRVGWLLASVAVANALLGDVALHYGQRAYDQAWPGATYAEMVGLISWIVACLGLDLLFLLFPDGHLLSRGWRWVLFAWLLGAALAIPGWALNPRLGSQLSAGSNPIAAGGLPVEAIYAVGAALVSGSLVASVVALLVRFRRSRRVEREQLKWVLLAGGFAAVALPLSAALWTAWPPIQYAAAGALLLLPVAVCLAIVRNHLYDIDLVISRSVTYAVLTGALAATYVVVVLSVGAVVSSPVAAAAAALVVAVAFRPLRDRIQDGVDRRFRRARHESRRVMTEFVDRLRRGLAEANGIEDAVRSAAADPDLVVAFESGGSTYDVDGGARVLEPVPGRRCTTVDTGHHITTLVQHRESDTRVIADIVDAGRLALEIAALQVELRRQLGRLNASRTRVVAVADEERRRLARDLHDGAQQRLVCIGLGLRHVQHTLNGSAPPEVNTSLDSAVTELTRAIDELRELAGGLRPASLDDGLAAALHELAARSPIPVQVRAVPDRFNGELEAAAYFIACEALTNAVKHASAHEVVLDVTCQRDDLVLTVTDNGRGGADPSRGSGILGLQDRANARGGTLVVDSRPGTGTRLTARLPCA